MMRNERGVAILLVLLAMMLLSALGGALALTTSSERQVAATYGSGTELFYATDAGFQRAMQDLAVVADWNQVLSGGSLSTFTDGAPGRRVMPSGSAIDLVQATDMLNCGRSPCGMVDLQAITSARPWGANNPVWRLYAHGPLSDLSPSRAVDSTAYIVVWVADDPLETDGMPLLDGDAAGGPNPGAGLIQLQAHAYGANGTRRVIEATLKHASPRNRVLSWREIRQVS